jgi:hypothetical protein
MPALPSTMIALSVRLERMTRSRKLRLYVHEARNAWMYQALGEAFVRAFQQVPTRRALNLFDALTRRSRVVLADRWLLRRCSSAETRGEN